MLVFEVTEKGFDGGTDKTDHKVKWIAAEKQSHVEKYLEKNSVEISTPVCEIEVDPKDSAIDFSVNKRGKRV